MAKIDIAFRYTRRGHGSAILTRVPASITSTVCAVTGSGETTGLSRCAAKHTPRQPPKPLPRKSQRLSFSSSTRSQRSTPSGQYMRLDSKLFYHIGRHFGIPCPLFFRRGIKWIVPKGNRSPMRRRNICIRKNQLLGWDGQLLDAAGIIARRLCIVGFSLYPHAGQESQAV